MKYKVIYKSNNKPVTIYFRNLRCAYELAEMTDGIVLNAKGAQNLTLKELIKAKGYTQTSFATKVGVTQPTVNGWVNGHRRPKTKDLPRIAKALGVSVTRLVGVLNGNDDI